MVEYVSAARMRTGGATVVMNFSSQIHHALTLKELIATFRDSAILEGVCRHRVTTLEHGRKTYLFGDHVDRLTTAGSGGDLLDFQISGWDEMMYGVEIALLAGFSTRQRRASLHTMATLYLCRGLALLDAEDEAASAELTAIERFCLDSRSQGSCDLDIAEALDRSVHAVTVHFQRAARKLHG